MYILFGILYQVFGAGLAMTKKTFLKTLTPRENFAVSFIFVPFGILFSLVAYLFDSSAFSLEPVKFLLLTCLFGFILIFQHYFVASSLKKLNITSHFKFQASFSVLLALLIDYFYFGFEFNAYSSIAGLLLLISAFILNSPEKEETKKTPKSYYFLVFLFLAALFGIFSKSVLKEITLITNNDFLGIGIIQTIIHIIVGVCGLAGLKKIYASKSLTKLAIFRSILIYFLVIAEFYAFRHLPLFVLVLLSNVKIILFLVYDHFNKDIKFNKLTAFGIFLGVSGMLLLVKGL